jgi:hypothetical protein
LSQKTWRHHAPDRLCHHPPASAGILRHPPAAFGERATVEARYIFYVIILTSSAGSRRHPSGSAGIRRTPAEAVGRRPELATAADRAKFVLIFFWWYVIPTEMQIVKTYFNCR